MSPSPRKDDQLALKGGPKAFRRMHGKAEPKLGVEEFLAIATRFGFKPAALKRLRATVSDKDLQGNGPNLARYFCAFPAPPRGEAFEALAREKFGVRYALGVSSGTGALHAAFMAAGVGPGTEVIVPAMGFMATGMAVILAGGVPVVCDVDDSLHLDPTKIETLITPRTVALAPTHHWGNVSDMAPILDIARRHKLKVIEDCAQAPGAKYRGKYVGSIGDIGCFSISAYKIIGGGEGGLVVTSDGRLFDRICQAAEGGGLWRPDRFAPARYAGELFPGTNYRLSELEATVNVVQLGKLDDICNRFRRVSREVRGRLRTFREITPQKINDPDGYIGYLLRFFPASDALGGRIVEALAAEGIAASRRGAEHRPDWHMARDMFPITLKGSHVLGGSVFEDPRWCGKGGQVDYAGSCPVAVDLFGREVMVSLDQWYDDADCRNVAKALNKVFAATCTEGPAVRSWI